MLAAVHPGLMDDTMCPHDGMPEATQAQAYKECSISDLMRQAVNADPV